MPYMQNPLNQLSMPLLTQAIPAGGWQGDINTWVYVGSAQFQIATIDIGGTADMTLLYTPGIKLAWSDSGGTMKFGYIASSSVTGGTTDVFIVPNTDYSFSGSAITNQCLSRVEAPYGFPGWFNYAATPSGFATVPVNTTYQFNIIGRTLNLFVRQTTSGSSNAETFEIPLPMRARDMGVGTAIGIWNGAIGYAVDNGTALPTPGRWNIKDAGTVVTLYKDSASGVWTDSGGKRAYFVAQCQI